MEEKKKTGEEVVRQFDSSAKSKSSNWTAPLIVVILVGILGVGSGFLITKGTTKMTSGESGTVEKSQISKGATYGSNDTATFKDTAEGVLKEGGIDGEGQFHLERPGGKSQYVYLTSSAVDLSLVVGRKIKVWGQTFAAEKAGWLMDVGKIEVLK